MVDKYAKDTERNRRTITSWVHENTKNRLIELSKARKLHLGQFVRNILTDFVEDRNND